MAASNHQQEEAVQSAADEEWVFLQCDGDAGKEQLLEEQDGDAKGHKESLGNSVDGQESARDAGKFLRWCWLAWKDVPVRNDSWDDTRPYDLGIAVCLNTVLHLLTEVVSNAKWTALHDVLTCLGNFTTAVVWAAVFSYATRLISLLATKASAVKKFEVNVLLLGLVVTNAGILLTATFACLYEVIAGLKVVALVTRRKYFALYQRLQEDMLLRPALLWALRLVPSLLILMKTDVVATFHTFVLHWRETTESRELFARRWLYPLIFQVLATFVLTGWLFLFLGIFAIPSMLLRFPDSSPLCSKRWRIGSGTLLWDSDSELAGVRGIGKNY
ncbi:hypothetical protein MTO96_017016 [Rhipicephalus appendiculatus]